MTYGKDTSLRSSFNLILQRPELYLAATYTQRTGVVRFPLLTRIHHFKGHGDH
jgi:hypothetical protein